MTLHRLRKSLFVVSLTLASFSGSATWASTTDHQKALEAAIARANAAQNQAQLDMAIQELQAQTAVSQSAPEEMHKSASQKNILAIAGGVAGIAQIPALAGFGHPMILLLGSLAVIVGIVLWLRARAGHASAEAVKSQVSQAGQLLAKLQARKDAPAEATTPASAVAQGVVVERSGNGKTVKLPGQVVIHAQGDVIVNVGGGATR